jgi:hypothetical protein
MRRAGRFGRLLLAVLVTGGWSGWRSALVVTDRRLLLARGKETTTARELIALHEIASVRAIDRAAPNVPGVPTGPSLALSVEGKGSEMTIEVPLPVGHALVAAIEYGRAADRKARAGVQDQRRKIGAPPAPPKVARALWQAGLVRWNELPHVGAVLLEAGYDKPGLVELANVSAAFGPPVTRAAERALVELGAPSLAGPDLARLAPALVGVCVSEGCMTMRAALDFISAFVPQMDDPTEPPELLRLFGWADYWGAHLSPYPQHETDRHVREAWDGLVRGAGLTEWRPDAPASRLLGFAGRS